MGEPLSASTSCRHRRTRCPVRSSVTRRVMCPSEHLYVVYILGFGLFGHPTNPVCKRRSRPPKRELERHPHELPKTKGKIALSRIQNTEEIHQHKIPTLSFTGGLTVFPRPSRRWFVNGFSLYYPPRGAVEGETPGTQTRAPNRTGPQRGTETATFPARSALNPRIHSFP